MSESGWVDITGRQRSPAATPDHPAGLAPPNKGQRYPADPPTVEEIILVMRQAGSGRYADRTRGLVAIRWRAGLRISETLALTESDLDPRLDLCWCAQERAANDEQSGWTIGRGSTSPAGPRIVSSCRSGRCSASSPDRPAGAAGQPPPPAASCGGSQPRPACAGGSPRTNCGMRTRLRWRTKASRCRSSNGGHAHLGITSIYLQGIDTREIIDTVHHRRPPVISASVGLRP